MVKKNLEKVRMRFMKTKYIQKRKMVTKNQWLKMLKKDKVASE
ncbi:hypothetical protein [Psychrobacillus sp. FSL K6-1415]